MWWVRFALFDRYADTQITSARKGRMSTRVVNSLLASRKQTYLLLATFPPGYIVSSSFLCPVFATSLVVPMWWALRLVSTGLLVNTVPPFPKA
ncbi:hypothetical protein ASPBRDRAFT_48279 [Aspergillus brasiliensis CBS 101740]|uniref:Uncharacterized protein n=1 Tax=Aspergillus brasiliensis (strain CBS 101740 / IMI 381727 / IBT 21946) TaxID=767769 RepID=A0A1L9U6E4_ASPBC|nr:hypothetical protein ASPBRDRAFT_48279 [Aspergillus brasiliensis CBS 101740]